MIYEEFYCRSEKPANKPLANKGKVVINQNVKDYLIDKLTEIYPGTSRIVGSIAVEGFIEYMTVVRDSAESVPMYFEVVDTVWHEFIVNTREYEAFCSSNFGKFIHHEPNTNKKEFEGCIEDLPGFKQFYKDVLKYCYTPDHSHIPHIVTAEELYKVKAFDRNKLLANHVTSSINPLPKAFASSKNDMQAIYCRSSGPIDIVPLAAMTSYSVSGNDDSSRSSPSHHSSGSHSTSHHNCGSSSSHSSHSCSSSSHSCGSSCGSSCSSG